MKKHEYLVAIADTDTAKTLLILGEQAKSDPEMFAIQRKEVGEAISARFCALNAGTQPNRKPRLN